MVVRTDQNRALSAACEAGDEHGVQQLLDAGANIESRNRTRWGDWPPLMVAAAAGHVAIIRLLIANGANLNERNEDGRSAIHLASILDKPCLATLLISAGADVNIRDNDNATPVYWAVAAGQIAILNVLVEACADMSIVNHSSGYRILPEACQRGNEEVVRWLLTVGVDADQKTGFDLPALFLLLLPVDVPLARVYRCAHALMSFGAQIDASCLTILTDRYASVNKQIMWRWVQKWREQWRRGEPLTLASDDVIEKEAAALRPAL